MTPLLERLTAILHQEVKLHEQLRDLLESEAQSFGSVRGSELLQLQVSKQRHSRKIERLERERLQVVRKLADDWDVNPQELRLRTIIARVEPEQADDLRDCHEHLTQLITEIREQADRNSAEAGARLHSVETALRFMVELHGHQQTYSGVGELQHAGSKIARTAV
ncbi:MAG: hypothetical protein CL923_10170 [Deltaproteobacteria bacterium]|nr:hypothetical protein [Deltaproteobacteria bacterium]MDP7318564.1 flagellar protein FlgN [SAR324 cluster bacterium]MDP7630178.1 flagellar protein FlgN [SAR324 cluster bacterium]